MVQVKLMLRVTPVSVYKATKSISTRPDEMLSLASHQGRVEILLVAYIQKPEISAGLTNHLVRSKLNLTLPAK